MINVLVVTIFFKLDLIPTFVLVLTLILILILILILALVLDFVHVFLVLVLGLPITMGYWTFMSTYGRRKNYKVQLPERNIEEYITIHDEELKKKYNGKEKIPMQVFHDAYFEGKIDFNGACTPQTRRDTSR